MANPKYQIPKKPVPRMDLETAAALLPAVGDSVKRVPTYRRVFLADHRQKESDLLRQGTVVEVSPRGLWYRVRFEDSGACECYKVPKLKGD